MNPYATRSQKEMEDVLMEPKAKGPAVHYYMIRGGAEKRNITVWEPGTVGEEYIKAYGHYHVDGIPETYWITQGEGILMLQKRMVRDGKHIDNELESCQAIFVQAGDEIHIPGDEGHAMINTGTTWLATVDDSPLAGTTAAEMSKPAHADYASIKKMKGFGYYVVKGKDGKPAFVKNTNYQIVPPIAIFETAEMYKAGKK